MLLVDRLRTDEQKSGGPPAASTGGLPEVEWRFVIGMPVAVHRILHNGTLSACQWWSASYWMAVSQCHAIGASGIRWWSTECADGGLPKDLGWLANWVITPVIGSVLLQTHRTYTSTRYPFILLGWREAHKELSNLPKETNHGEKSLA